MHTALELALEGIWDLPDRVLLGHLQTRVDHTGVEVADGVLSVSIETCNIAMFADSLSGSWQAREEVVIFRLDLEAVHTMHRVVEVRLVVTHGPIEGVADVAERGAAHLVDMTGEMVEIDSRAFCVSNVNCRIWKSVTVMLVLLSTCWFPLLIYHVR